MNKVVKPYDSSELSKKEQVEDMFDSISPKYDFLNHFLSFGIDHVWRKKAINLLKSSQPKTILDVATGTGDLAFAASKRLRPDKIIGIDISNGMLEIGRKKILDKGLNDTIEFVKGDSEFLPFGDNQFDAVMVSFGVRNFENLHNGLCEIFRVLKKGGSFVVLEFSKPKNFPIKQFYRFYSRFLLPKLGGIISKDQSAYHYLPASVAVFPEGNDFVKELNVIGFTQISSIRLSGGIATIYYSKK